MTAKFVVCISESERHFNHLRDAIQRGHLDATIGAVISDHSETAEQAFPVLHFALDDYRANGASRADYDADVAHTIQEVAPDYIVLLDWHHKFGDDFLRLFPHQVVNLHYALPDMYWEQDAIMSAYQGYLMGDVEESGCTIHFLEAEVGMGEVIAQASVPILADDTLTSFEDRLLGTADMLLIAALQTSLTRPKE